jgi:hypothetical protein
MFANLLVDLKNPTHQKITATNATNATNSISFSLLLSFANYLADNITNEEEEDRVPPEGWEEGFYLRKVEKKKL